MKTATKAKTRKPLFLYDVVCADGSVVETAVRLPSARTMAKTWNDVVGHRSDKRVSVRKAWRVMPIESTKRKAVK